MPAYEQAVPPERTNSDMAIHTGAIFTPGMFLLQQLFARSREMEE
jgi:hypothetical protein